MHHSPTLTLERRASVASELRQSIGAHQALQAPVVFVAHQDPSDVPEGLFRDTGWRVHQISSASTLLAYKTDGAPSCLLLDVSRPELGNPTWQEHFANERPETQVVCIADQNEVSMIVRAMKAGALDVLAKPLQAETLIQAIRVALDRSAMMLRQDLERRELQACFDSLSQREREVMRLVVSGLLNKQVGGELGISEITVKAHRGRVMRKMHARSLANLFRIAARLDLRETQGSM